MAITNSIDDNSYEAQVARFPEPDGSFSSVEDIKRQQEGYSRDIKRQRESFAPKSAAEWIAFRDGKEAINVAERRGQLHSSIAPQQADLATGFRSSLDNIYKMEDPVERNTAYYQLLGSRDAMVADAKMKAITQAETEAHLPELQKMYEASLARDKADKYWPRFMEPSEGTQRIQDQITQAGQFAKGQAEKYFLGNSEIQSITKSLDPELKAFEKINDKLDREALKKQEKQQALIVFGEEARNLTRLIVPDVQENQVDATAVALTKNPMFQQVLFTTDPSQLLPMARAGNKFAQISLIDKQAAMAAGSRDGEAYEAAKFKAAKDYTFLTSFADNPAIREGVLSQIPKYAATSEGKASPAMAKFIEGLDVENKSPEARANRVSRWMELGNQILSEQNKANFEGNIKDWAKSDVFKDPSTPIGKLYAITQESMGEGSKVSIQNLTANIKRLDPSIRANAHSALVAAARDSANKFSGAYYGNFTDNLNTELMIQQYIAEGIQSTYKKSIFGLSTNALFG